MEKKSHGLPSEKANNKQFKVKQIKDISTEKKIDCMSNNTLNVVIDPIGKPRMTQSDRWKNRKCVDKYYAFADRIREAAREVGFHLGDSFRIVFRISTPASYSKKKALGLTGKPHQLKPDIDNLIKSVMDALKADDQSVYSITASKVWDSIGSISIENGVEEWK
jgi:Holliday junction resolvase RusA-like endonuclease